MKEQLEKFAEKALDCIRRAQSYHQTVLHLKEQYEYEKRYGEHKYLAIGFWAYVLIFLLEISILGLAASVFFQTIYQLKPFGWEKILLAIFFALGIGLALFYLIHRAAFAFTPQYYIHYQVGQFLLHHDGFTDEDAETIVRDQLKKAYPYSLLILIFTLLFSFILMTNRVYITNGQMFTFGDNWTAQFFVLALSSFMLFTLFLLAPWVDIRNRRRKTIREFTKALKGRTTALNQFRSYLRSMKKLLPEKNNLHYVPHQSAAVEKALAYHNAMQMDRGSLNWLVPEHKLVLRTLWNGSPIDGVNAVGFTTENERLHGISDENGSVSLRWRDFAGVLSLVSVGNRQINDVQAQDEPIDIELTNRSFGGERLE
jgi:hypothetical protein